MRTDKFLKVSRLIKRREIAKELCQNGSVSLNGKVAKASSEIAPGDELTLRLGRHTLTLLIRETRPFASKEQASGLYEILADEVSGKGE